MKSSRGRGHFIILNRDQFRCVYCGVSRTHDPELVLTVDHIVPVQRGGSDRADNLVACCLTCNVQKQARVMSEAVIAEFVELARRRNMAEGIADHQIIDLKNTSSTKRSRREWDTLTFCVMQLLENMVWFDHANFESARTNAMVDILCLAIRAMTEYTRLTGDLESANEARALLRRMAVDACVAGVRALPGVGDDPDREFQAEYVASRLETPGSEHVELRLGSHGIATLIEMFFLTGRAKPGEVEIFGDLQIDLGEEEVSRLSQIWQEELTWRRSYERGEPYQVFAERQAQKKVKR